MKASFMYALRYVVQGHCVTPLRTGGADGDTQTLLRGVDGRAFLQGSSLAGALRGWKDQAELFGSQEQEGALYVSDLLFEPQAVQSIRPRVRIDGKTGTAAPGGKFDVASLLAGSAFGFTLVWRGQTAGVQAQQQLEAYLAALDNGAIVLGAQRANGFGRVKLDKVVRCVYDMKDPESREAWMQDREDGTVIKLPNAPLTGRVVFAVTAAADALLVKAPAGIGVGSTGVDAVMLEEGGRPVVPGSSIKGAFRAQMRRIAPALGISEQCLEEWLGRGSKNGDNGVAGKLRFSDATFTNDSSFKINRIRLDRFTGGVMRGGLFSERPVCGLCSFTITTPADAAGACRLLAFALRDLGCGRFTLGGGAAQNHGRMNDLRVEIAAPGGKTAVLQCRQGTVKLQDPNGLLAQWQTEGGAAQ